MSWGPGCWPSITHHTEKLAVFKHIKKKEWKKNTINYIFSLWIQNEIMSLHYRKTGSGYILGKTLQGESKILKQCTQEGVQDWVKRSSIRHTEKISGSNFQQYFLTIVHCQFT